MIMNWSLITALRVVARIPHVQIGLDQCHRKGLPASDCHPLACYQGSALVAGEPDGLIARRQDSVRSGDITRGIQVGGYARPGRAVNEHVPQGCVSAPFPWARGDLRRDQLDGHRTEGAGVAILVSTQVNDRPAVSGRRRLPPGRPGKVPGGYVIGIADDIHHRRRRLRVTTAKRHRHRRNGHRRRNASGQMAASGKKQNGQQHSNSGPVHQPARHDHSLHAAWKRCQPPCPGQLAPMWFLVRNLCQGYRR
jgi:hypothetical protein